MVGNSGKYAGKDVSQVFYEPLARPASASSGSGVCRVDHAYCRCRRISRPEDRFEIVGRPKDPAHKPVADVRAVSPSLYPTLGIRLLRGRLLSDSDGPADPAVAVVNEAFVTEVFPQPESAGTAAEDRGNRTARDADDRGSGGEYAPDGDVGFRAAGDQSLVSAIRSDRRTDALHPGFVHQPRAAHAGRRRKP